MALLNQSLSSSFTGASAARTSLMQLPEYMVQAALPKINSEYLWRNGNKKYIKQFIAKYEHLTLGKLKSLFEDLKSLGHKDFSRKYYPFKE